MQHKPWSALLSTVIIASLVLAASAQAATRSPGAGSAAPGSEAAWPQKGKSISLIVPYVAGGSTDTSLRPLVAMLEKDLGIPIQYLNKEGAGGQIGVTELSRAKPDGYTLGVTLLPAVITMYLNPDRQATFTRKSFQPIAMFVQDPQFIGVKADSPYKTLKDLIEAAKAKPKSIKDGCAGILSPEHLAGLRLQKLTGTQFATVQFDGAASVLTTLLGGHVDMAISSFGLFYSSHKSKQVRLLSINDKQVHPLAPEAPPTPSLGIDLISSVTRVVSAPAGTPKPIVDKLTAAFKKAIATPAFADQMKSIGITLRYMDPDQTSKFWEEYETEVAPLVKDFQASQK